MKSAKFSEGQAVAYRKEIWFIDEPQPFQDGQTGEIFWQYVIWKDDRAIQVDESDLTSTVCGSCGNGELKPTVNDRQQCTSIDPDNLDTPPACGREYENDELVYE